MVIAPFLIWLLCIGIAALMIGNFLQEVELKEGFVAVTPTLSVSACPNGTTSYVNKSGYTNCCEGDIINDACNGREVCSLSPSVAGGPPTCADFFTKEWIARGRRFCPPKSMPNYFGTLSRTPGTEGCSASPIESDGSRPSDNTMPKCRIYGNINDEMGKSDSCYNAIGLDAVVCPQTDAKKSIVSYGSSLPMIFKCNYIPKNGSSNGMPVDCMDANRAVEYVNRMDRTDKAQAIANINSGSDVQFCNGSKAYYVDRTLTSGAKSVPGQSCPTATATASTGFVMSGPNIQGTVPVQHVGKLGGGSNDPAYFAQVGDLIIVSPGRDHRPVGDPMYPNGLSGSYSFKGNLSDFDLSSDFLLGLISTKLQKSMNLAPLGYTVSKVPTAAPTAAPAATAAATAERSRLQKAKDAASKAAALAKQTASRAGAAAINRASAAASKIGNFFRR